MKGSARMLRDNGGIPRPLLIALAAMAGISVANIYYCQPLLAMMGSELGISEMNASLIAMVTQAGYACGLFFVIPAGDMVNRRKIVTWCFLALSAALSATSALHSFPLILAASFVVGMCSVMPQIFIPMAAQFSEPEKKGENVGYIVTGLLTGILASRVISGLVGTWLGWRAMYAIAAAVMLVCTAVILRIMPDTASNYSGTYGGLMKSLAGIAAKYRTLRLCSLRSALAFGSFLALWSSLTFRMEQEPFYAGSGTVGLLGLCGIVGALMASVVGRFVSKVGVRNFNIIGCSLILLFWLLLFLYDSHYSSIIAAIILIDIGMQCIQLSNQTVIFSLDARASNRINTIFMTSYFLGGSLGTLLSGAAWSHAGWTGVTAAGALLAGASLLTTLSERKEAGKPATAA